MKFLDKWGLETRGSFELLDPLHSSDFSTVLGGVLRYLIASSSQRRFHKADETGESKVSYLDPLEADHLDEILERD